MTKESLIRGLRLGIAVLSASIATPVLCGAAGILVGLAALLTFGLEDVPAPWNTAFEVAYLLFVAGGMVAGSLIGWGVWKFTA
jgi:hypothetical protein